MNRKFHDLFSKQEIDIDKFEAIDIQKCKYCSGIARPNILMFGDGKWNAKRTNEQEGKYHSWISSVKNSGKKMVIIEIGAGTAIPTIRNEGNHLTRMSDNINLIRINPKDYEADEKVGVGISLGGLDGIKAILNL